MEEITTNATVGNESGADATRVDEQWHAHVKQARVFLGSDAEYCRRNKLELRTFKRYKEKFGFTRPYKPRTKAFVRVERKPEEHDKTIAHTAANSPLPDARWTAEFVAALMAAARQ